KKKDFGTSRWAALSSGYSSRTWLRKGPRAFAFRCYRRDTAWRSPLSQARSAQRQYIQELHVVASCSSLRGPWLASVVAAQLIAAATAAFAQTADIVFVNGKVFTADGSSSLAEGFAVKDGHFVAVGTSAAMRAH